VAGEFMIEKDKVLIRRLKLADRNELIRFFKFVLEDTIMVNELNHETGLLEEEFTEKIRRLDEDLNSDGQIRYFLLAEYQGEIIGSIEYGPTSTLLNDGTKNAISDLYEIGTVLVLPKYQRQGIVSLLFDRLLARLELLNVNEVCFDSGYKVAQRIWTKKFGKPEYYLKDYWGKDAHLMVWRINVKASRSLFK